MKKKLFVEIPANIYDALVKIKEKTGKTLAFQVVEVLKKYLRKIK